MADKKSDDTPKESQELTALKEKLKTLEHKRDKRIPDFTAEHRVEALQRVAAQIMEVQAEIKKLSK